MSLNRSETIIVLLLIFVALAVIFFAVFRLYYKSGPDTEAEVFLNNTETNHYTDLENNEIDLASYDKTVRVVASWASWCPFCVQMLSDFAVLAEEFDQQVTFIAINRKEPALQAKSFIDTYQLQGKTIFVQDSNDYYYKSTEGFSMPEIIFFDTHGNIAYRKRGTMSLDEMKLQIENMLVVNENN